MDPVKGAIAGAAGGLAGAYAMERFQSWWHDLERRATPRRRAHALHEPATNEKPGEPATVKAAERIAEHVLDAPLTEAQKARAGEAVHYGFGAASGAVYGFVSEIFPPARMFNGLLFGAVLWWTADNMAVPANRLGAPPEKTPPSTHAYALASHLVHGFVTETVRSVVRTLLL